MHYKLVFHLAAAEILFSLLTGINAKPDDTPLAMQDLSPDISDVPSNINKIDEGCYYALVGADANGDGIVKENEYARFIDTLSNGKIEKENYEDLPFHVKLNFASLRCLCEDGQDWSCCKGRKGGIYTNEAGLDDTKTAYLDKICTYSRLVIDYVSREDDAVNDESTYTPLETASPTSLPSIQPTNTVTFNPSRTPTLSPFLSSSPAPTNAPSVSPITAAPAMVTSEPTNIVSSTVSPSLSALSNDVGRDPTWNVTATIGSMPPSTSPIAAVWNEQHSSANAGRKRNIQPDSDNQPESLSESSIAAIAVGLIVSVLVGMFVLGKKKRNCSDESKVRLHSKSDIEQQRGVEEHANLAEGASVSYDEISAYTGISSLRTSTFDSLTEEDISSALVRLRATPAIEDITPVIRGINPEEEASKADLKAAIEAGDWTLVGNTAELLASSSSQRSTASNQAESIISDVTELSSITHKSRVLEFYKLVDVGDWDGIILAASMLEGASDSDSLTANDFSPLDLQDKAKLQAQVVDLVRAICPDEIEYVDEMLAQFQNREMELVQTLLMMQEKQMEQRK